MFIKHFIIASLANSFPVYLAPGRAALFDNFQITGVNFYFSTVVTFAVRCDSEAAAEVWVAGLLHVHPRFAPLVVIPIYNPAIQILTTPERSVPVT